MSSTGSSSPDISEKPNEGNTQQEIREEHNEGETQEEEINEEPIEGSDKEEIIEKSDEGNPDEETGEESNEGNTGKETGEEQAEGSTRDEISVVPSEGSTGGEIKEEDTGEKMTATKEGAQKIFEQLKEVNISKIILLGETGTGKTWMANEICKLAAKEEFDEPIWISLDKKHDRKSFEDTVTRQFCLRTSTDEREDDGDGKKEKKMKSLKETMMDKLIKAEKAKQFVLLVLDGQLEKREEDQNEETGKDQNKEVGIERYIKEEILGLKEGVDNRLKVLITRRKVEAGDSAEEAKKFGLEPFSGDEASKLLREKVVRTIKSSHSQAFDKVCEAFQQRSRKPAEILMLAGTLNYIASDNDRELKLKPALEIAASDLTELWRYAYDKEPGNSMIDCFWHSWNFLGNHGGVHYNELITRWIMESCLPHTNQIEKAYEEGHRVLMNLIDYHMLKMQEEDIIVLEGATLEMKNNCRRGYFGTADPGLASVLKGIDKTDHEGISPAEVPEGTTAAKVPEVIPPAKVLEGITPADGMMKTLCGDEKEKMISSVLIDGSRLCREIDNTFFGAKQNLNLLAIFSPRLKSPEELSISNPEKLLVLMLRRSYLLENVNIVDQLRALTVLEISGSKDWKINLTESFFEQVSRLRSLDLSGAGITSLPDSFSNLTELRRLILKGCSSLEKLPKLGKFNKLEVIDLSDCTSLKKIQEKSFESLKKLKVIDFSGTIILKLPIVKKLKHLTILLLKGCSALSRMRMLKEVKTIKVLDLSGATNMKEIMYDCFEGATGLREVDLSETQIQFLPLHEGNNFQKLRLRGCKLLRNLPELRAHTLLEELDLSGCEKLETLPELRDLQKLKILDLRDTKLWSKELVESLSHIKDLEILS